MVAGIDSFLLFFKYLPEELLLSQKSNIMGRLNKEFMRSTMLRAIFAREEACCYDLISIIYLKIELHFKGILMKKLPIAMLHPLREATEFVQID